METGHALSLRHIYDNVHYSYRLSPSFGGARGGQIVIYFRARRISLFPGGPGIFSIINPASLKTRLTVPLVE
jgi:hypothetical protein